MAIPCFLAQRHGPGSDLRRDGLNPLTWTTPPNTSPIVLDPERLLGFQPLAAETRDADPATDWTAALADLHNKIGEVPPPEPS